MIKKARAAYVLKRLQELYPNPPIPLDHKDPYTLLIAVLLSAQCTDVRVNQITPTLFARADTPEAMLQVAVEEIREIIRPCGLSPMKSKGIAGLSRMLVEDHGGVVPADMAILETFPGVGHKTASVVMRDLKRLFPEASWNALHLQIIYYGREYCSARGCDGTICPICRTLYPNRKRAAKVHKA